MDTKSFSSKKKDITEKATLFYGEKSLYGQYKL